MPRVSLPSDAIARCGRKRTSSRTPPFSLASLCVTSRAAGTPLSLACWHDRAPSWPSTTPETFSLKRSPSSTQPRPHTARPREPAVRRRAAPTPPAAGMPVEQLRAAPRRLRRFRLLLRRRRRASWPPVQTARKPPSRPRTTSHPGNAITPAGWPRARRTRTPPPSSTSARRTSTTTSVQRVPELGIQSRRQLFHAQPAHA